ncbi:hypothetical protein WP8S18E06_42270 [Klebsiella sp. WP8-S18-ESBL-06]|nr:hypothetical protein WP8S18E06_42270 [Klebsiella sp. WP8-S18-ESBL-06]
MVSDNQPLPLNQRHDQILYILVLAETVFVVTLKKKVMMGNIY